MTDESSPFEPNCVRCKRLSAHLASMRDLQPKYYNRPVASFGARYPRALVVGLAPGLHGANRTGRVFTGDSSGTLLFRCLHRAGLASKSSAEHRRDGLKLERMRITNAVKCLPPGNRPTGKEITNCLPYLRGELGALPDGGQVLALGKVAHDAVLRAVGTPVSRFRFAHGAAHALDTLTLRDSYHCSRLNVNTGRLTEAMLQVVIDDLACAVRAEIQGKRAR